MAGPGWSGRRGGPELPHAAAQEGQCSHASGSCTPSIPQAVGRLLFKQPGLLPALLDGSAEAEAR